MSLESLYQELIRVPLIWHLPQDRLGGTRVSAPVALLDVAPTLLDFVGLHSPDSFRGQSLRVAMEGGAAPERSVSSEMKDLQTLIEYPWKLIRSGDGSAPLLFDLAQDPAERNDLGGARGERVAAMSRRLDAALPESGRGPVPEVEPGEHDPQLLEQLKALGYVP